MCLSSISTGFNIPNNKKYFEINILQSRKTETIWNISNAMDYIPGLSVISGLARTIFSSYTLSKLNESQPENEYLREKTFHQTQLVRGIISTLCLGIIFAPFDLFNTFSSKTHFTYKDTFYNIPGDNFTKITPGFQTSDNDYLGNKLSNKGKKIWNVIIAMDYIPGLSIISGLGRTILYSCNLYIGDQHREIQPRKYAKNIKDLRPTAYAQIARGVISTLGLGIIFAPFDLHKTFSS